MQALTVNSNKREEMLDITRQVQALVKEQGWQDGILFLFCTHTTAALTINEAADPSVAQDMLHSLQGLVPLQAGYRHVEGNSDAHIKASIIGCSEQALLQGGKLALGTWQGIFFAEFDGPRSRRVIVALQSTE